MLAIRSCDSGIQGPENLILALAGSLQSRGVRYVIVNLSDGDPPVVALHDEARRRGFESRVVRQRWGTDPRVLPWLVRLIRQTRADVIHAHDVKSDVVGLVAAKLTGRPIVGFHYGRLAMQSMRLQLIDALVLRAFRRFDRVLANSTAQSRELIDSGIPADRIGILPSFVDTRALKPPTPSQRSVARERLGLAPDQLVLSTIARLSRNKGHTHMLRALAQLQVSVPHALYLVVGEGDLTWRGEGGLRAELEQEVRDLRLVDRVRFLGYYPDLQTVLHASDIVVSPSLREGMQVTLLEAMAAGRAIVATAVGGTPDAITDGETGLLVAPTRPDQLARAIERLAVSPELLGDLGRAARVAVEARFDVDVVATQVLRVGTEITRYV